MTDSPATMLGHVALRLRLVYESTGRSADSNSAPEDAAPSKGAGVALHADSESDIPGWKLVGLLPEDVLDAFAAAGRTGAAAQGSRQPDRFVTEPVALTLDRDEAEGYYLNLTSPQPSLFALIRLPDVASATAAQATSGVPQAEAVTASYAEAARWMDGGMVVIRTPLPEPMLAWIAEFAQYHYQVGGKKQRGKFRPSFLSRREFGDVARAEADGARSEADGAGAEADGASVQADVARAAQEAAGQALPTSTFERRH